MGCAVRLLSSRRAGTREKKTKPCWRCRCHRFCLHNLAISRTCLLRLYFRSVALSISFQSLSSSILLFFAMFTFCLTFARNHQDGRIWAPFRRGYSSGFTVAFQLHQHFGFLMGFTKPCPDHLCFLQPCGLASDYNPGWSHTRHSVSPFSLAFVDPCQPPSLLITVSNCIAPLFPLTLSSPPRLLHPYPLRSGPSI